MQMHNTQGKANQKIRKQKQRLHKVTKPKDKKM